uniref:DNA-directed DNA polymerase n=1 Tax=Trichuris muris TaxID=70415 RepID=A0A5S6QDJ7_TRIMR
MLPTSWNQVLFPGESVPTVAEYDLNKSFDCLKKIVGEHAVQDIRTDWSSKVDVSSDSTRHGDDQAFERIRTVFPFLAGSNLKEHFQKIAEEGTQKYKKLLDEFSKCKAPHVLPEWKFTPGWTKYPSDGGKPTPVAFPDEDAFVFDVEVCLRDGNHPVMATAMSSTAWYSWCSRRLCCPRFFYTQEVALNDLIPLQNGMLLADNGNSGERIVIGHNVGFDRAYVKEQYNLKDTKLRFWDTMSMHIAVCGLAGDQRILYMAARKGNKTKAIQDALEHTTAARFHGTDFRNHHVDGKLSWKWLEETATNSLVEVHRFHCPNSLLTLDKDIRSVFVSGSLEDVRKTFQTAMTYCAMDVAATFEVFVKLMPQFWERFPHPVTFMGMLEMGTSYLPTDKNWFHYIRACDKSYKLLQQQVHSLLVDVALKTVNDLVENSKYTRDPWFWNACWKTAKSCGRTSHSKPRERTNANHTASEIWNDSTLVRFEKRAFSRLPKWYSSLLSRISPPADDWENAGRPVAFGHVTTNELINLTPQLRIMPKLLKLHWNGYPLHFSSVLGWGYLIPGRTSNLMDFERDSEGRYMVASDESASDKELIPFPLKEIEEFVLSKRGKLDKQALEAFSARDSEMRIMNTLQTGSSIDSTVQTKFKEIGSERANAHQPDETNDRPEGHDGIGPFNRLVALPGVWFYKLPHKDSPFNCVANPLGKGMLQHIENGNLQSFTPGHLKLMANVNLMCSYWKNNRDRIMSQMVVCGDRNGGKYCSIIPRVICAGTVTRRAVESTWMTVSNPEEARIGSELKGLIKAPLGYKFVGSDVDSQELWIAALFGDSHSLKIHGCTPNSWMLLKGDRNLETDQHSVTAREMSISRSQAKVLNYGRMYGAGRAFAVRLLKGFRQDLSSEEAVKLATRLYRRTKGRSAYLYELTEAGLQALETTRRCFKEPFPTLHGRYVDDIILNSLLSIDQSLTKESVASSKLRRWFNGSESEMFNALESIAYSKEPRTPVLQCRISRALEPSSVDEDFLTSRVNWVVQSSAVDYLHVMLVSMKWLCQFYGIDARFSISIHDEVRYLVSEKDKYVAALALQYTNLLTRSFFAVNLDLYSLPKSVAFFSQMEVDQVLRKSVESDCKTPSNPFGLTNCYSVPPGQTASIEEILEHVSSH